VNLVWIRAADIVDIFCENLVNILILLK